MAKISARGATEVARLRFRFAGGSGKHDGIMVLRSDGKVLRRLVGDIKTGYSIMGTVKAMPKDKDAAQRLLERVAERRRMEVVK